MKERIWINRVASEIVFQPFVCMTTQLEGFLNVCDEKATCLAA